MFYLEYISTVLAIVTVVVVFLSFRLVSLILKMSAKICLSLNDKMKVVEESEKGNSVKALMNTFKCGKTQIMKNKTKIKEEWFIGKFI